MSTNSVPRPDGPPCSLNLFCPRTGWVSYILWLSVVIFLSTNPSLTLCGTGAAAADPPASSSCRTTSSGGGRTRRSSTGKNPSITFPFSIFGMFHRPLGWYCSYCAAPLELLAENKTKYHYWVDDTHCIYFHFSLLVHLLYIDWNNSSLLLSTGTGASLSGKSALCSLRQQAERGTCSWTAWTTPRASTTSSGLTSIQRERGISRIRFYLTGRRREEGCHTIWY